MKLSTTSATTYQQPSSSSSSKKRKMDSDKNLQKYYAVRSGVRPGVYLSYPECMAQISGFRGAQFKSFTSYTDAKAFVAGQNPSGPSADAEEKFYAVARGNTPGIYTDWDTASLAIKGAKAPKFKKFPTKDEAKAFIMAFGDSAAQKAIASDDDDADDDDEEDDEDDEDEEEEEDGFTQPPAKKMKPSGSDGGVLHIYTDGSSLSNGKAGAVAGVGVFFGSGDARNISERLKGEPQTNQRAELTAILRALQTVSKTQSVQILTDSKYAIHCVLDWYKNWIKNGWRTSKGELVLNQDLIQAVRKLIDVRDKAGSTTGFTWVKGHASDAGNLAADKLAVQGAKLR